MKTDGGQGAVVAAPEALACIGRDKGFGRGPVLVPVGFILRADLPQVDGEGRIPGRHVAFFLQPRIGGRQGRDQWPSRASAQFLGGGSGPVRSGVPRAGRLRNRSGRSSLRGLRPILGPSKRRDRGRRRRELVLADRLLDRGQWDRRER